jgi:hypothetical protein
MLTLPPTVAFFSKSITCAPRAAKRIAAARPPNPAPIMMTDLLFKARLLEGQEYFARKIGNGLTSKD